MANLIAETQQFKQLCIIATCKTPQNRNIGTSALNPGAVFLRFFPVAFLHFLTPEGGSNPAGPAL